MDASARPTPFAATRGRLATATDDAGLRALMRADAMPGAIRVAVRPEPSFFDALEVQGHAPRVIVGEQQGRIAGMGVLTQREGYYNGTPATFGYLSHLRLGPELRRTSALGRGYRLLRRLMQEASDMPFCLSTIMEDNRDAMRLLTSGRAGLPEYRERGRLRTLVLPVPRRTKAPGTVETGATFGAEALAAFLQNEGARRQFYPRYTAADIASPTGRLRGLDARDFLVVRRGTLPVGTLALWDQGPFRRHVVTGYAGWLRGGRPVWNLLSRAGGLGPPLPPIGGRVAALFAAGMAVAGDDPDIFDTLLDGALAAAAWRGAHVLLVGMMDDDPLTPRVCRRRHLAFHSRLYTVSWPDAEVALPPPDGRPTYLELGSL